MNEKDILDKIRSNWSALHLITLENTTSNGIPDINFCHEGHDVWMELKVLKTENVWLEKFQAQFHVTRNRKGGKCLIFAANKEEIRILRLSDPLALRRAREVNKFRVFDTTDSSQLELVIQWSRPFRWAQMFEEFMEKIRCL